VLSKTVVYLDHNKFKTELYVINIEPVVNVYIVLHKLSFHINFYLTSSRICLIKQVY